jgi:hypothetical protein
VEFMYKISRHYYPLICSRDEVDMMICGEKTILTFILKVDASRFVSVMQRVNVNHVKVYIHGGFGGARNVLCKT